MKPFNLILLLILFSFISPVFSHSGRTDGDGGHNDRIHGGYHYHHGKPAHEVCGEACPYNGGSGKTSGSSWRWLRYIVIPGAAVLFVAKVFGPSNRKGY